MIQLQVVRGFSHFQFWLTVNNLKGGHFGEVVEGTYTKNGITIPVAIKSVKDDPTKSDAEIEKSFVNFLEEIKLNQCLGDHDNVVKYIGAITTHIHKCE